MITFRIRPLDESYAKSASFDPTALYQEGEPGIDWEFSKHYEDLTPEDHEFAKALDAEETEYYLAATPQSREAIRKSNPDSPVGEEEEVAVEVEAPDGSVTAVAAAKPAGEAVTVTTPEVSVTSAPAGTQTGVMKAANGNGGFPPKKKDEEEEMDEIDKALYSYPIYKSRDGTLYYKETEAKLAAKVDEMEEGEGEGEGRRQDREGVQLLSQRPPQHCQAPGRHRRDGAGVQGPVEPEQPARADEQAVRRSGRRGQRGQPV